VLEPAEAVGPVRWVMSGAPDALDDSEEPAGDTELMREERTLPAVAWRV
jgi:hypothetical protein